MNTKFKYFMAATALAVGFASCSNDDDNINPNGGGEQTSMTISIPMVKTYATNEGITQESEFTKVDVFIFNGNSFESHKSLTKSDFNQASGVWTLSSPITTTTGTKNIYVGLNLSPADTVAIIRGVYSAITFAPNDTARIFKDNEFPMFSVNSTTNIQHIVGPNATDNVFPISVERWAAKVTARKGQNLVMNVPAANATFTELSFCLGNLNTKMYPLQKKMGSIVEDPNWEGFHTTNTAAPYGPNDFVNQFGTDIDIKPAYIPLDNYTSDLDDRGRKYAMENTSKNHKKGEVTYISVRGKFIPNTFHKYDVDSLKTEANNAEVTVDLYVVKDVDVVFFKSKTDAERYAKDRLGIPVDKIADRVLTYKGGYSYFHIWLDAQEAGNIHATLRNRVFDAMITEIKSLGNPNPQPTDPDVQTPTTAELKVEVSIKPWTLVSSEHQLED